ncbi:MAG: glycosyltransferase family 4 protein [Cyclobacteriaceae bacterium]
MALVIGLIYGHNENWIAGSYYIQSLVSALKALPGEPPQLNIYSEKQSEFDELKSVTRYPDLKWIPLVDQNTIIDRIINKISYILLNRHFVVRGLNVNVDVIFPATNTYFFERIKKKLFWIPDFQEHYYPHLFSASEIQRRKKFQLQLIDSNYPIVFSSQHAAYNFSTLYPRANNQVFVMPFAVTLPDLNGIKIEALRFKYGISENYFICSNQFWAHKNHLIVLKALLSLQKKNFPMKLVFTGKLYDDRNPEYFPSLERFVIQNRLEDSVKFLGFIDRTEQLVLMKNCLAVIQPSLFEGWSTVVEDAKALDVPILVSDIPVHHEQLGEYPFFFSIDDDVELARLMRGMREQKVKQPSFDYQKQITDFGLTFLQIVRQIQ